MFRQYHAGRWFSPGDNPLRVGPIAAGSIYRLPASLRCGAVERWIVEAFLNGVQTAARRDPATGRWEDCFISGRSDRAVIRRLSDGYRQEIPVRVLLACDAQQGVSAYPRLPDVRRFHAHWRAGASSHP